MRIIPARMLAAIGCQLRITDGVLDVVMPEIGLQRRGVDAGLGEFARAQEAGAIYKANFATDK